MNDSALDDSAGVDDSAVWLERARHSWRVLVARSLRGRRFVRAREPGRRRPVALWPLSQALWAASIMAATETRAITAKTTSSPGRPARTAPRSGTDPHQLWRSLRWYRGGGAYLDNRPRGRHYFDDNAWIALVAAQQAQITEAPTWWESAAAGARFLETGCTVDGGVLWVRGGSTVNACSTGAAGLLFAVLAASPAQFDAAFRSRMAARAEDAAAFLRQRLLRSDGLVSDHVRSDGTVEPSVWTYNQGLAVALFDRTGHVDWADELEHAVTQRMPADVRHGQPAAFTSIWYRTQLARHPDHDIPGLREYLQSAWDHGRDERGLFSHVDRYDGGVLIDHAAITGLMAAFASGPALRAALL